MKTKTKKTKPMRRLALTAALLLMLALLLAFDALNGDPLSQQWAIHRAIRYAEKLYPKETFHWDQRTAADGQFFHYVVQYHPCTHRQLRRPQCVYGRCTGIRPDARR